MSLKKVKNMQNCFGQPGFKPGTTQVYASKTYENLKTFKKNWFDIFSSNRKLYD